LAKLSNLRVLDVSRNPIQDIQALGALKTLQELDIRGTKVRDVEALGSLTNLTQLWIDLDEGIDLSSLASNERLALNGKRYRDWSGPYVRDQVFISYSRANKTSFDAIEKILRPSVEGGVISVWHDQEIKPGSEWFDEITKALSRARVGLLLAGRDFFASSFICGTELPNLLKAAKDEGITILWVPINQYPYETSPLKDIQAIGDPVRPLEGLSKQDQESQLGVIGREVVAAYVRAPRGRRQARRK
jgi:hypothetical protein